MIKKRCTACLLVLPETKFYRQSRNRKLLFGKCKDCHRDGVPVVRASDPTVPEGHRRCTGCLAVLPLGKFRTQNRVCKECKRKRTSERVAKIPNFYKLKYARKSDQFKKHASDRARRVRADVIHHYGGFCVCCGESNLKFLTLDHIYGNGGAHRRATNTRGGTRYYYWVRANGFPDFLRVLCYNCNLATYRNGGICPHEEARLKLVA